MNNTMPKVIIGGHRGMGRTDDALFHQLRAAHADWPVENTIASIAKAFDAGADYVEIDAVMSGDGHLFVMHNVVPDDHYFGENKPSAMLNTLPYIDLKSFRSGRHSSEILSSLDNMLEVIAEKAPRTAPWLVNVEIKGVQKSGQKYEKTDFIKRLANVIESSLLNKEDVLFSSFSLQNIIAMSHLLPDAQYGMLFGEHDEGTPPIYADYLDDAAYQYLPFKSQFIDQVLEMWKEKAHPDATLAYLHPEIRNVTLDKIRHAAQKKLGLNTWANNESLTPERLQHYRDTITACAKEGVALTIITDYIDAFR